MSPHPASSASSNAAPTVDLNALLRAIGNPVRWWILATLAGGESFMVVEIAERVRQTDYNTSKHLAILREAGIVAAGRNGLYQIKPQFITDKAERIVDFGYCLLRLNTTA